MQDRNLLLKLVFIALVALWAIHAIIPFNESLKGGIDLEGGYSLLYEIDTTGLTDTSGLSTKVMDRLKQRVDPGGVRNLVWRPVGDTRLEIQMPIPPKDVTERRKAYQASVEALRATNISIAELEQALTLTGSDRQQRLEQLVRNVPSRNAILPDLIKAYDAWQKASMEKKDSGLVEDLVGKYESQLDKMLATNIDMTLVNETVEMQPAERARELQKIYDKYPARKDLLDKMVAAHDKWAEKKGPLDDPSDLMRLLRGAGVLEFRILAEANSGKAEEYNEYKKRLADKGPRTRPEDEFAWYEVPKADSIHGGIQQQWGGKTYVLAYAKGMDKVLDKSRPDWKLVSSHPTQDQTGLPSVAFEFNDVGAGYFMELTRNNIGNALCIILDGKAYSAPVIRSQIGNRGVIEGKFTNEEVNYLVSTLNAGSLDARLKDTPIANNSIGPSLGQDNTRAGLRASIIAMMVVVVFMIVYYTYAGFIADIALFLNILLLLAMMATLQATFTMAGIAGVILSIGMAVDANVLIFERMREEKQKVQSLRLIIKNGFDRALPTILDSNITTIITCVVLYYIASEEIKGFALTLGLGLVINIFTAVFVTKIIFNLLVSKNMIKSLPMLHLFPKPNVDWVSKQKIFWSISIIFIVLGLGSLWFRGDDKYDIEFRGGTSATVELKEPGSLKIDQVRDLVKVAGKSLINSAEPFRKAELVSDPQQRNTYILKFSNISPARIDAAIISYMEDQIEKGSVDIRDAGTLAFKVKPELKMTAQQVSDLIKHVADRTQKTGQELAAAQVQSVGHEGKMFEIVTTATSQRLVVDAIVETMGKDLKVEQSINYDPNIKTYPITKKRLGENIGDPKAPGYIPTFNGGVGFVVDRMEPAVTVNQLKDRIIAMRLQPDFEKLAWRNFEVIGLTPAEGQDLVKTPENQIKYTKVAMVVADPSALYDEDENLWKTSLVNPEMKLLQESLLRKGELQKVTQFAGQVADQAKVAAILAMLVSFGAITMYLWIRFGTIRHGFAANVATIHDILASLGFIMFSYWFSQTSVGQALLISDFKLNLAIVAAILTLIGYSVNDTIVIFDRIRENQGKLKEMTPQIINNSINQTLSRTILTAFTVLVVMVLMYIYGGEGARGFCYVMILGTLFGSYSSIAIAAPILLGWKRLFGDENQGAAANAENEKSRVLEPVKRGA